MGLEELVTGRGARAIDPVERRSRQTNLAELQEKLAVLEDRFMDGPQYPELDRCACVYI